MPHLVAPWESNRTPVSGLIVSATEGETRLEGKRVLVVEDEYIIASDLAAYLTALGAEVVGPVTSIQDAMAALCNEVIDAAILDIDLQGDKAFNVADRLLGLRIPFVFATGYDAQIIPKRFSNVMRCEKPTSPSTIVAALLTPGAAD